jgi:hydroxymethylpyrimidine/phosphomethylpyrimidine kinase
MTQVLSIAGSDSCGGAGLQADLKTFAAFGVDGATVVTAVTAQNTAGVRAIQTMSAAMVQAQMDAVFEELAVDAVKLGMLANADIVATVAQQLERRRPPFVVLDPVLLATSGAQLLEAAAVDLLRTHLLPLADCLTPNLAEAAALLGVSCAHDERQMITQGRSLLALGAKAVVMKGGHAALPEAVDLLVTVHGAQRFPASWISTRHVHGTGCMLSAGITASVARGCLLADAVARAKAHVRTVLTGREVASFQRAESVAAGGSDQSIGA